MFYRMARIGERALRNSYYLADEARWSDSSVKGPPKALNLLGPDLAVLLDQTKAALERDFSSGNYRVVRMTLPDAVLLVTNTSYGRITSWRMVEAHFPSIVQTCTDVVGYANPVMKLSVASFYRYAREAVERFARDEGRVRNGETPLTVVEDRTTGQSYFQWVAT